MKIVNEVKKWKIELIEFTVFTILMLLAYFIGNAFYNWQIENSKYLIAKNSRYYADYYKVIINQNTLIENVVKSIYYIISFSCIAVILYCANKDKTFKRALDLHSFMLVLITFFCNVYYGVDLIRCGGTYAFLLFIRGLFYYIEKKEIPKEEKVTHKEELQYEDLFRSRKKQIEKLVSEVVSLDIKSHGLIIKGSWGTGKTTFMRFVKERLKENNNINYEFINVTAGYQCDIDSLLDEIKNKLVVIISKYDNQFSTIKLITDYFALFSKVADNYTKGFFSEWLKNKEDKLIDEKQNQIRILLQKINDNQPVRIIIVIDDIERCPSENVKNIFAILTKTLSLDYCLTVVLTDYAHLLKTPGISSSYLQKYFDRSFVLSTARPKEMWGKMLDKNKIEEGKIDDTNINNYVEYITLLSWYSDLIVEGSSRPIRNSKSKLPEDAIEIYEQVYRNIINPRCIEYMCENIYDYLEHINQIRNRQDIYFVSNFIGRDTVNAICQIVILKHVFENLWDELIQVGDWDDFLKALDANQVINRHEGYLFKTNCIMNVAAETSIVNALVFNTTDTISYNEMVSEVVNDNFIISHVNDYINLFAGDEKIINNLIDNIYNNRKLIEIESIRKLIDSYLDNLEKKYIKYDKNTIEKIIKLLSDVYSDSESNVTVYGRKQNIKKIEMLKECGTEILKVLSKPAIRLFSNISHDAGWGYPNLTGLFIIKNYDYNSLTINCSKKYYDNHEEIKKILNAYQTNNYINWDELTIFVDNVSEAIEEKKRCNIYSSLIKDLNKIKEIQEMVDTLPFEKVS